MKIAVLGGSSFSTPALFQDMQGEFVDCEFRLVGRSAQKLQAVSRAAQAVAGINGPSTIPIVCDAHTSQLALTGVDVVLIQMRIGNMPGRRFDESFPLAFDLCGDEGLGAGGMSAAWRAWPVIEGWLAAIAEHAPQALVLMMSSPVGILTRAARVRFPSLRCFGICEVPYIALRDISTSLEVPSSSIEFEYLGINHIGWLYAVRSGTRDLAQEWAAEPLRRSFPGPDIVRDWGGIPTKYLRLHFQAADVLAAQRSSAVCRADELNDLQESASAAYATEPASVLRQLLGRRATPWYADSIIPLLKGLRTGDAPGPFFLSGPNHDHRPNFAGDDILEIACRIEGGAVKRIESLVPAPDKITASILEFVEHERLAADAVIYRQESQLRNALEQHPWIARATHPHELASNLAQVIVGQQYFH